MQLGFKPFYSLSRLDYAVVALLARGFSVRAVAGLLGCSVRTVEYRLWRLRVRFSASTNYELVGFCAFYVLQDDLYLLSADEFLCSLGLARRSG